MSQVIGNLPAARIIALEQTSNGVGQIRVSIPVEFAPAGGLSYPVPAQAPDLPGYSFVKASGREDSGGNWSWELLYEGQGALSSGPAPNQQPVVYAFEPSDMELDIRIHPNFIQWLSTYGGKESSPGSGVYVFPETNPNAMTGKNLVSGTNKINPLFGVQSFTSYGGTWTKNYSSFGNLPAGLYANVQQVVTTVPMPSGMQFPDLGSRNWLKRMPTIRQRGATFDILERYVLSGLGGHNTVVYNGNLT